MQPIITRRLKHDFGHRKKGDPTSYKCGDCGSTWKRFSVQKHKPGCPRQLRNELEHKTTKEYFKRPASPAERSKLTRARKVCIELVTAFDNSHVNIYLRNKRNPNGWSLRAERKPDGTIDYSQSRSINTAWAMRMGYQDAKFNG
jgi:hypothetical protein